MDNNYVIEMLNITKEFPGIIANDDITLQLKKGEIHALLGENGAGKSTLMSVLFGLYQAEKGTIKKDGQVVEIRNPNDANALGIGMVHQHFKLVEIFSVLDNIILGKEPCKAGFINRKEAREKVVKLSEKYELNIDPDAIIENVSVGMQQRVEILKMLYRDNEILIFDEPTAVLTPQEIKELMQIMKKLISEGKSILFITHKLEEIKAVANRCTVLRKGKCIDTVNVGDVTIEEFSEMMVGRKVSLTLKKSEAKLGKEVLRVENVSVAGVSSKKDKVSHVSFEVREGEIVCIAGIDGNGQQQLVDAVTGMCPIKEGKISLNQIDITKKSVNFRNEHGISYIPEDRHRFGLVLDYDIANNLILKEFNSSKFQNRSFLKKNKIDKYSENLINQFDIRSGQGSHTPVRTMSGGNQQKIILAREMDRKHNLLIAVQPARGLDVGAIEQIHKKLIEERDNGVAVLLVSLELSEVMNVSDRILVISNGEIVAELNPKKTTTNEIGLYMAGVKKDAKYAEA